jgi:tetratricopeptide (TPR) repeat protein
MNKHTTNHASDRIDTLTKAIVTASSEAELTQLYIERGHCYNLCEDEVNSVRDYLSALDTATNNSDIVHIKSMIALALARKEGQKEQALFWAMSAVDQDSRNAEGYHTLGLVCDICGFLHLAIESLQRAIYLKPDSWDSMRLLGSCLRENGQLQEAVEILSRYVANNPDESLGLYDLAWSLHVSAGGDLGKLKIVKEMYEKALMNNPSSNMRAIIERKLEDIHSITN